MNTNLTGDSGQMPGIIGIRIIDNLLNRPDFMYYHVGDVHAIHYAEACAALGALRLAGLLKDTVRVEKLKARYAFELSLVNVEGKVINTANHVDANVYGIVPLEIFLQTGDRKFLEQGLALADGQWQNPLEDGMSSQTRYWIDDIYMIASLQTQAFRATDNGMYLERAALEVNAYLEALQQPNGLFYHGPDAKFFWGRGNGWVAAGLAELLQVLPQENKYYANIRHRFVRMMRSLINFQCADGMWRQLLDNESAFKETSCSAMFGYSICAGLKSGILSESDFAGANEKTWLALSKYVTSEGNLNDICTGTGQSTDGQYYLERPRVTGDLHGQAALLWFCHGLLVS